VASQTPVLIYDGDCGFCRQCLNWGLRRLTAFPHHVPSTDPAAKNLGLSQEQFDSQVWLLLPDKNLGGASAVSYVFRLQPNILWRFVGWAILIGLPISNLVYRWVAKNRGRLGKRMNKSVR
jgi:predicted DCC family thiol-disulfide oxidoreductase YuxK